MKYFSTFFVLLLMTTLNSCSKPYRNPEIVSSLLEFNGINYSLTQDNAASLIMIHGMCHHDSNWLAMRARQFGELFDAQFSTVRWLSSHPSGVSVYYTDLTFQNTKTLRVYGIVYARVTAPFKRDLCFDASSAGNLICPQIANTSERANINSKTKTKLINECISDAVIYLGKMGIEIRQGVGNSLASIFRHIQDEKEPDLSKADIFLLGESLGSKVLLDSVGCTQDGERNQIQRSLKKVKYMYLVSNQIPLLSLDSDGLICDESTLRSSSYSGFKDFVNEMNKDVKVISFADPNDLLSYELRNSDVGKIVTSVLVSNDWTILGQYENVISAHTDYAKNTAVANIIMGGYFPRRARWPKAIKLTETMWDLKPKTKFLHIKGEVKTKSINDMVTCSERSGSTKAKTLTIDIDVKPAGGPMKPSLKPFSCAFLTTGNEKWEDVAIVFGDKKDQAPIYRNE
jgi:hypothetical protein